MIYLYEYSKSALSTKPISELIRAYLSTKKNTNRKIELEGAIITRIEQESYRNNIGPATAVLGSEGLSDRIMLRALELISQTAIMDVSKLLEVLDKENSLPVKKSALGVLAEKGYLHTLEEMREKPQFANGTELRMALENAIRNCIQVCTQRGYAATLAHPRLRRVYS